MQIIIDQYCSPEIAKERMMYAWKHVQSIHRQGGEVALTLGPKSKSRDQEAKYHAMINDIAKTVRIGREYNIDSWKALLVDAFQTELRSHGKELRHPGRMEISFDNQRMVSVRPSTTKFTKAEGSMFIEFLYMWGTEHGATFNESSLAYYDEVMK